MQSVQQVVLVKLKPIMDVRTMMPPRIIEHVPTPATNVVVSSPASKLEPMIVSVDSVSAAILSCAHKKRLERLSDLKS